MEGLPALRSLLVRRGSAHIAYRLAAPVLLAAALHRCFFYHACLLHSAIVRPPSATTDVRRATTDLRRVGIAILARFPSNNSAPLLPALV